MTGRLPQGERPQGALIDLLLDLCRSFGVEVLVLRHEEKDAQAQWCESIVEIMTVFCSSLYGKRSHKNRRAAAVPLAP